MASQVEDWPDKQDVPYRGLIRILPQNLRGLAVARAIEAAAQTLTNKEAAGVLTKAAHTAINHLTSNGMQVREGDFGDYPPCGNDLSWLLRWLDYFRDLQLPIPDPDPYPFYNLVTLGLIGLVSSRVEGPVREGLVHAAQHATQMMTTKKG